jgi:hypothetical protein
MPYVVVLNDSLFLVIEAIHESLILRVRALAETLIKHLGYFENLLNFQFFRYISILVCHTVLFSILLLIP